MRFAVRLRNEDGVGGGETEWVMLFMIVLETNVCQIVENEKNVSKTITYHYVENIGQLSNPE